MYVFAIDDLPAPGLTITLRHRTSQRSSTLSALVDALHNLLDTARTSDWIEQVRWLSDWRHDR